MTVLFIRGLNDLNQIEVSPNDKGLLSLNLDGSCNVLTHLQFKPDVATYMVMFGGDVKQPDFQMPALPALIFNQISDPDSHPGALKKCLQLCEQIDVPVINHPKRILATTRDQVCQALQGIPATIMPKNIRCQPRSPHDVFKQAEGAGISFPFIVRIAGTHGGKSTVLIKSEANLQDLHVYPFDGGWFYLTEFVDYRSSDGLYRKLRIVVVDGKPLFRHLLINDDWMVHASSRKYMDRTPGLWKERNQVFDSFETELVPMIQSRISAIQKKLGLEYFGIDCNLNEEGEMLIFEANANMNNLSSTRAEMVAPRDLIKQQLMHMIREKFAIDI